MDNTTNNWDCEEYYILINKEGEFMCSAHDTPRTWDWCGQNCLRYYSCDTIAWQDDEYKLLTGEAWRCPKCEAIVNNGEGKCRECGTPEDNDGDYNRKG